MKKGKMMIDFLIGGCIGKTLMEISGLITNLFIGNNFKESISQFQSFIILFFIGGIVYICAKLSVKRIENKDLKSKDRQEILKKQMFIVAGAIFIFSIFLIVYMINKNYIGAILSLSFCAVFSFWGYAFLLSYIDLKNSMAMITKKRI